MQGVTIMATVPHANVAGAQSNASWREKLAISVAEWAQCSNSGSAGNYGKNGPFPLLLMDAHTMAGGVSLHTPSMGAGPLPVPCAREDPPLPFPYTR
jgi:hypothetical protein